MTHLITNFILSDRSIRTARGQKAITLLLLTKKVPQGVVARDFHGGPLFRLPVDVRSLRWKHGLMVQTDHLNQHGGWYGRFVQRTPLEIIALVDPAKSQV